MSNEPLVDIMTLKVGDCVKVSYPAQGRVDILKVMFVDKEDEEVMVTHWLADRSKWGPGQRILTRSTKVVKLDMCPDGTKSFTDDADVARFVAQRIENNQAARPSYTERTSFSPTPVSSGRRRSRRSRRKTRARKSRRYRK